MVSRININRVILIIVLVGALVPLIGVTKSVDLEDISIFDLEDINIYDLIDKLDSKSPTDDRGVPWSEDELVPWNKTSDVVIDMFSGCREVFDGDTFRLDTNDYIRLADIQAPEFGELGYAHSRNELTNLILGTKVYLDVDPIRDIYGRYVCVVYIQKDDGFINVNKYMASNNYATFWEMENQFINLEIHGTNRPELFD